MIEELIDLQLFDAVIGQVDRHIGNIMVDENGHVFGIDNDQCLPDRNADHPEVLASDYQAENSFKSGTLLPVIITTTQKDKWLAMNEETVVKALRLATKDQRNAAIARFRIVQAHIRNLKDNQVVDRSTLLSDEVKDSFLTRAEVVPSAGPKMHCDTNYFGRYLYLLKHSPRNTRQQ
jgi:hypothetical protein